MVREAASYYGSSNRAHTAASNKCTDRITIIDRTISVASKKRRGLAVKRSLLVLIAIAVLVVGAIPLVAMNRDVLHWPAHTAAQTVIAVKLSNQCSDNPGGFICLWCQAFMPWHFGLPVRWDDVKYGGGGLVAPGDNIYGPGPGPPPPGDDCPHCIVYSGPASIQMISTFRTGVPIPQDAIYDSCELDGPAGEFANNGICERHGFGVLDGTGGSPQEIQTAFMRFVGPVFQHNQWDGTALTAATLESYIRGQFPVLWSDHNGWPSNMDPRWPSAPDTQLQGHYKVIGGYDDGGTPGNYQDDLALVFDPWPGYNDLLALNPTPLPPGALPGPGGPAMPDPYWLPIGSVLGDIGDLFLVEFMAVPEFSGLLIPIVGMTVVAIAAIRIRTGRREP